MSKREYRPKSFLLRLSAQTDGRPVVVRLEEISGKREVHRFADLDSFFNFLRQRTHANREGEPTNK